MKYSNSDINNIYHGISGVAKMYYNGDVCYQDLVYVQTPAYVSYNNNGNVLTSVECSDLTDGVLESGMTSADKYSTYSIEIGNCVTSIGEGAFGFFVYVSNVTIPNSVTSIGRYAFNYCSKITNIDIPNNVTSIGNSAFQSCSALSSATLSNKITEIPSNMFYYCTSLTDITIPNSVTSIGDSAFYYCSGLTSVNIPSGVTSIGLNAFFNCSSLTSIEIPDSVTSIDNNAFYSCSGLTSITIDATTPPTLQYGVFNNTNNCPIYVPSGSVDAYKTARQWSTYASRIQAIPI